ncbi:MAG: hypothetical protein LN546_03685 [Rickettsia endosymbiont of Ecitomorpha arachnoides]|nr:hypothetical protein [Rickettsia endosymbiont of Ecitomorpha arachnoides]
MAKGREIETNTATLTTGHSFSAADTWGGYYLIEPIAPTSLSNSKHDLELTGEVHKEAS